MFCKVDLGRIILAKSFYDVLYSPEVPDGEKETGWGKLGVKHVQTNKEADHSKGVRLKVSDGFNTNTNRSRRILS